MAAASAAVVVGREKERKRRESLLSSSPLSLSTEKSRIDRERREVGGGSREALPECINLSFEGCFAAIGLSLPLSLSLWQRRRRRDAAGRLRGELVCM